MKIYWKRKKDKKYIDNLAKSNRSVAKRMINLNAAVNFLEIIPNSKGRAHFLKGKETGLFAIDIYSSTSERFICEPYGNFKKDVNGDYIKETITEILILKIEKDYH